MQHTVILLLLFVIAFMWTSGMIALISVFHLRSFSSQFVATLATIILLHSVGQAEIVS